LSLLSSAAEIFPGHVQHDRRQHRREHCVMFLALFDERTDVVVADLDLLGRFVLVAISIPPASPIATIIILAVVIVIVSALSPRRGGRTSWTMRSTIIVITLLVRVIIVASSSARLGASFAVVPAHWDWVRAVLHLRSAPSWFFFVIIVPAAAAWRIIVRVALITISVTSWVS